MWGSWAIDCSLLTCSPALSCPARVLWRLLALAGWASLAWRFQFFRLAGEV